MAIAADSFVIPNTLLPINGTPNTANLLAQPPHVGIVTKVNAGDPTLVNVQWDTTIFNLDCDIGGLREIQPASAATIQKFAGQVVRRVIAGSNQSAEFVGAVIFLAKLITFDPEGVDIAVIKSVGPGNFFWVASVGEIDIVPGR